MPDRARSRARRPAAATRRGARPDAARSAPAGGRSRAPLSLIRRRTLPSPPWTKARSSAPGAGRAAPAGRRRPRSTPRSSGRARRSEALAADAAELEATLPGASTTPSATGSATRRAGRTQPRRDPRAHEPAHPPARALEGDLLAERHARVDDLALLVDLVTSGWQSVDERLGAHRGRSARAGSSREGAVVYRIEDRREAATS